MEILKVLLTGGPCAGKTSVIYDVKEKLEKDGYYVVVVPETAAELISKGIVPNIDRNYTIKFQELVLETQMRKEKVAEEYCEYIRKHKPNFIKDKKGIVILYDRGVMDNRAYLEYEDYVKMLDKYNYNELKLIDKYDTVIDLISSATKNPELYCLDGIRYETQKEAAYRDLLTSSAWILHSDFKIVNPTDTIEEKQNIVFSIIKNKLKNIDYNDLEEFEIDERTIDFSFFNNDNSREMRADTYYIQTFNDTLILEQRQHNNNKSYILKRQKLNSNGLLEKYISQISEKTFEELINTNLVSKIEAKSVLNFIDNGNYFSIVIENSNVKLYTKKENIVNLPYNICIKKPKTLIKQKNMVI